MTVVLPRLPPPGGSTQEVLFRRMLLQCSHRVEQQQQHHTQEAAAAGVALKDWRTDAKFHCILEALQERLYDLEQAKPDVRPDPATLQQYQAAVRAITSQLQQPQLPSYCLRVAAQDRLPGAAQQQQQQQHRSNNSSSGVDGTGGQPEGGSGPHRHRHSSEQQQQQQQQGSSKPSAAATSNGNNSSSNGTGASNGGAGGDAAPSFSLSSRAQAVMTTQQRLQDELTDELLDMGQELKSSTLAMQNAIRYRGKLLDETETSLVHSADTAKAVAAKAKEQYRQGNWNLCHTCIIVLSVFVIFSFMLVAIRVSSMVGLKGN